MNAVIVMIIALLKHLTRNMSSLDRRVNYLVNQLNKASKKEWHEVDLNMAGLGQLKDNGLSTSEQVEIVIDAITHYLHMWEATEESTWLCVTLQANRSCIYSLVRQLEKADNAIEFVKERSDALLEVI